MLSEVGTKEAKKLLENGEALLLDVRHRQEVEFTSVEPHVWVELSELPKRFSELPKGKTIICICRTGVRSGIATEFLREHGYNALNLAGGIFEWGKTDASVRKYFYSGSGNGVIVTGAR